MDPVAQVVIQTKYTELRQSLSSSNVTINYPGVLVKESYHVGHRLDGNKRSIFAQIRAATHRQLQVRRAIKTYVLDDAVLVGDLSDIVFQRHQGMLFSSIINEITMLSQLRHTNIVPLFEVFLESKYIHLVMGMCKGGELYDFIYQEKRATDEKALSVVSQILDAIQYMHNLKICHRALCIENIMFVDREHTKINIIGFSSSGKITDLPFTEKFGSPFYMAPEIFSGRYTELCDIWSVGVILYTMLLGFQPIQGETHTELVKNIQKGSILKPEVFKQLPQNLRKLIKTMIAKENRPNASSVLENSIFESIYLQEQRTIFQMLLRIAQYDDEPDTQLKVRLGSKLKYAACKVLDANQKLFVTPHLDRAWSSMDTNRTGSVNVEQMKESMAKCVGENIDVDSRAQLIFSKIDIFNTGLVTHEEFIYFAKNMTDSDEIANAFKLIDPNYTGAINAEMLAPHLSGISVSQIDNMLAEGIGKETLEVEEFINLIAKYAN